MPARTRRSVQLLTTATAAIAVVGLACGLTSAAGATPVTPGATGYAAGGYTGTATMRANLTLTGALGGLLNGVIGPIVSSALNPLVAALQGTATSAIGGVLGASGPNHVTTPINQSGPVPGAFPADLPAGLPSPCATASTTQPCFNVTSGLSAINVPPLVNLGLSVVSGYTQQVPSTLAATNQIFGRAQVVGTALSVLPAVPTLANPLISTGTVDSVSVCPSDGTSASAQEAAANVRLLGGLVTFNVASDKIANLVVNGVAYASINALPTVSVAGVVVQPYGTSVEITLPLTLAQVATGLGLPSSVITTLGTYGIANTSLNLSVIAGPDETVTKTSAQAWGLGLGVDLSGALGFNLLGLVGATVAVPTGIGAGNLGNVLDLRLGYTACTTGTSGSGGSTQAVPPALV
jgi:hypothetical protein